MDRLRSMEAFVTAADSGSYASAAERLGMSAQMVAKHVAALEKRLGAQLLNRTTRRQSLTELGRAYYERCRRVLEEAQAADSLAQICNDTARGKLRVSAPVTFGSSCLMPFLTEFLRQHSEVEIDLHLTDRFVDLVEDGYEVVFRIGPLAASTLTARPLMPYGLVACAAASYLAKHGSPDTPSDLQNHECLGYAYWSKSPDCEWLFRKGSELERVQVSSRLRINESRALIEAALDGFGIVLGPEILLAPKLRSGQLIQLLSDYEAPSRPMHLLYTASRLKTAKVRRFIDAAVTRFGAA